MEIDYKHWISQSFWTLEQALCLINGKNPDLGWDWILDGNRTYFMARVAIKKNILPIDGTIEKPDIQPRDFLNWAQSNDIEIHAKLKQYINYDYWTKKIGIDNFYMPDTLWTFNEAISILYSKTCPFPHEITNVFEREETYVFAKKVKQAVINEEFIACDEFVTGEIDIFPVHFLMWAEKQGIPIPTGLKDFYEYEKERDTQVNLACDGKEIDKENYKLLLSFDSWELEEALWLLVGIDAHAFEEGISKNSSENQRPVSQAFWRSHKAGKVQLIKERSNVKGDYSDGLIEPKEIIQWAIDRGLALPELLKEAMQEVGFKVRQRDTEDAQEPKISDNIKIAKLRNQQRHKERCRALASYFWSQDSDIQTTTMARKKDIINYGCEGRNYKQRAIENWIRDLSPNKKKEEMEKKEVVFA